MSVYYNYYIINLFLYTGLALYRAILLSIIIYYSVVLCYNKVYPNKAFSFGDPKVTVYIVSLSMLGLSLFSKVYFPNSS